MKKIIVLAIVSILVAASAGMVLVKTDLDNWGSQMYYNSTATMYGVGTSDYKALVLPDGGPNAWAHLEQEAELEIDIECGWCGPKFYYEIEQDTELDYAGSGAIASVDTFTQQYGFGEISQDIVNIGEGYIDTFQFVKTPVWP